jgi:histidinol-phosphate aminotransferase
VLGLLEKCPKERVNQYPTRDATQLLDALAASFTKRGFDLKPENFVAGNGGDEVLDLAFKAFVDEGDRVAVLDPSYSFYTYYVTLYDAEPVPVALDERFRFASASVPRDLKLAIICSPNNPTGNLMPRDEVVAVVERGDCMVLVDEAYVEFADEKNGLVPLVDDHANLIVLRTFSKVYALAGARVGYAIAAPETAELLRRVKPPFNVNVLSEFLAVEALKDPAFREATLKTIKAEKPKLAASLEERGFRVFPSDANFLLTVPPGKWTGPKVNAELRKKGIAARTFEHTPRLRDTIRFTVGTAEQNAELLVALASIVKKGAGP